MNISRSGNELLDTTVTSGPPRYLALTPHPLEHLQPRCGIRVSLYRTIHAICVSTDLVSPKEGHTTYFVCSHNPSSSKVGCYVHQRLTKDADQVKKRINISLMCFNP